MSEKKPAKCGNDYLRGPDWKPRLYTRKGIEQWARRQAAKKTPKGFWTGVVADCGDYWRVNFGGQPFPPLERRS